MKAGGCKQEFKVYIRSCMTLMIKDQNSFVSLQDWSKCVDDERKDGKDFTEECKDRVMNGFYLLTVNSMTLSACMLIIGDTCRLRRFKTVC